MKNWTIDNGYLYYVFFQIVPFSLCVFVIKSMFRSTHPSALFRCESFEKCLLQKTLQFGGGDFSEVLATSCSGYNLRTSTHKLSRFFQLSFYLGFTPEEGGRIDYSGRRANNRKTKKEITVWKVWDDEDHDFENNNNIIQLLIFIFCKQSTGSLPNQLIGLNYRQYLFHQFIFFNNYP